MLFSLYVAMMWLSITKNMLAYVDNISLEADITSPATRQIVTYSLTVDLMIIQSWRSRCSMKLKPSKSKEMLVRTSRTLLPQL